MKISYNWLKQYINFQESAVEIAALLTDGGLEVESVEPWQSVKGGLQGIVVGSVLKCEKHPDADRLSLCKVDAGTNEVLQIVCGAPNVAAGQKVMVALVGTKLFPVSGEPFEIKKSKIRGEVSEGMLCAEDEVGLGTSHAGLLILSDDAKVGSPVADYLGVENDFVFEIGLTPNRADAASHIGVARDLKAIFSLKHQLELSKPSVEEFKELSAICPINVEVKDQSACPRYSGVYIKGVIVKESPAWLQNRLKAVGMRPVNNVVDVTNFVMLETGQPMHAFDATKIKGNKIIVGQLPANTVFRTLDGVDRKLNGTELMICNDSEGMCIAGVFGGLDAGVNDTSSDIFLESAWFNSVSIRKSARLHGLHTDSSFRFERGTDPDGTVYALKRAALLLKEVAGGEVASSIIDIYNQKAEPFQIKLTYQYAESLIGMRISPLQLKTILQALDIVITAETEEHLDLAVPPFKVDVTRPADVVEEILRIYGYNAVPLPSKISTSMPFFNLRDPDYFQQKITTYLTAQGFNEVLNNSLSKLTFNEMTGHSLDNSVHILNPLSSDLNVMRSTMAFAGLETLQYNQNRQQERHRIFEFGKTYLKGDKGYRETNHLSIWLAGNRYEENWQQKKDDYNIYYLKSILLNLLKNCAVDSGNITMSEESDPLFSFSLSFHFKKKELARFGVIDRKHAKQFDLMGDVFYADVNIDVLLKVLAANDFTAVEPSRFPEVRRDLSMVLDRSVQYEQLEELAYQSEPKLLKRINLFDIFEGEKIGAGKKSYAVSFFLRDEEATLKDKQIDGVMQRLMEGLEKKLGAVIRKQ